MAIRAVPEWFTGGDYSGFALDPGAANRVVARQCAKRRGGGPNTRPVACRPVYPGWTVRGSARQLLVAACVGLLTAPVAQAQHTLSSYVVDHTFSPMEGVVGGIIGPSSDEVLYPSLMPLVFEALPFDQTVVTDSTGTFAFTDLVPGRYFVAFKREGFREVRAHVTVPIVMPEHVSEVSPVSMRPSVEGYLVYASCYVASSDNALANAMAAATRSLGGPCRADDDRVSLAPLAGPPAIYHLTGDRQRNREYLEQANGNPLRVSGGVSAIAPGEFSISPGVIEWSLGRAGARGWILFKP